MKKVRMMAVALATVASVSGMTAASALAENTYTADGSGTTGGTPSKPKPAKLSIFFETGTTLGATFQPKPVVQYKLNIEGGRLNRAALNVLPKCKPTPDSAAEASADQCPKKSIVGNGVLTSVVGVPDTVFAPSLKCSLPFNQYNLGNGKLGLFIDAGPPTCPIPVAKWVIVPTSQQGRNVITTINVPKSLQEIAPGTFATVISSSFVLNPIIVKVKGKKQSVTESIGCTDKKRTVIVDFTDISGGKARATKILPC